MKALTTNGLTKLIQLIKSTFIPNTDVETTTEMDVVTATAVNIDNTPTQSSTNLVTSGGVYDAIAASGGTNQDWGCTLYGDIIVTDRFICAPRKCYYNVAITSFSAPNVTECYMYDTFYSCANLVTISGFDNLQKNGLPGCSGCGSLVNVPDFPSLTIFEAGTNNNAAFSDCYSLVVAPKFDNLETIAGTLGSLFRGCTSLVTPPTFNKLKTLSGILNMAFEGCSSLQILRFPSLDTISGIMKWCCRGCTALTDLYFNAVNTNTFINTDALQDILQNTGTSVTHTIHFPSNMSTVVSTLTGYPLFGGTSGYVTLAFDLPATT